MERQRRRVRGPIIVAAFLLLTGAGVVGGYLALRDYPRPADIVDVVNIDGRSAVLIRTVAGPDERSFISVFEYDGRERWGAMIPRYRVQSPARPALAATGDVVFVRTDASGQWAFFAFDAERGHKLGRIEPFETRASGPGAGLARVGSLSGQGQAFEFGGDDGQWAVIYAFDLRTGTLSWTTELGAVTVQRVWLRAGHIAIATDRDVRVLDRQSGALLESQPARGEPCATADALYYNSGDGGGVSALAFAGDMAKPTPLGIGDVQVRGLCARRGEQVLMAVSERDGPALLALDRAGPEPGALTVTWRIPLPGAWNLDDVAWHTPDRAPLSGEVDAFVPVLAGGHLLMLDVGKGRVAWRSDNAQATRSAQLMQVDGEIYMYRPEGGILAVFDARTGRLDAARALPGFGPVWPRNIAGGAIWVARATTFALLDAHTLTPLEGEKAREVGDDIRAIFTDELAIPAAASGP